MNTAPEQIESYDDYTIDPVTLPLAAKFAMVCLGLAVLVFCFS